jgi:hypothetical protein
MASFIERRRRRTQDRDLALRYQIEHARLTGRLEALVLADDSGLPLAYAGDDAVCEELAAMAPFLNRTVMPMPMSPLLRGADVAVRTVRVHGMSLHLASIGGTVARDALLASSLRGVERILASN